MRRKVLLGILVIIIVSTTATPVSAVRDTKPYDRGDASWGAYYSTQNGVCLVDAYSPNYIHDIEWAWVGINWNPSETDYYRIEAQHRLWLHMETPHGYPYGYAKVTVSIKVWMVGMFGWLTLRHTWVIFEKELSGQDLSYSTAYGYRTGFTNFEADERVSWVIGVQIDAIAYYGGVVEGYYPMSADAQMDVTYIDYVIAP